MDIETRLPNVELVSGHLESPSVSFLSVTQAQLLSFFPLGMGTEPTALPLMVRCSAPKLSPLLLVYSIVMVSVVNDQFDKMWNH